MEQARLVRWLKNPGDTITQGEPVLELETEKSVVEIEATVSGRLVEQLVRVDEEANVGDRVAWLETETSESTSSSGLPSVASSGSSAGTSAQASAPKRESTPPSENSPSARTPATTVPG